MKQSVIPFVLLAVLAVSNVTGSAQNKAAETTPLYQGGLEMLNEETLSQEARRIGQEAVELLTADSCLVIPFVLLPIRQ